MGAQEQELDSSVSISLERLMKGLNKTIRGKCSTHMGSSVEHHYEATGRKIDLDWGAPRNVCYTVGRDYFATFRRQTCREFFSRQPFLVKIEACVLCFAVTLRMFCFMY